MAIGAPDEDIGDVSGAGAVNVIYGSALGLHGSEALPDQFWHQDSRRIGDVAEGGDSLAIHYLPLISPQNDSGKNDKNGTKSYA